MSSKKLKDPRFPAWHMRNQEPQKAPAPIVDKPKPEPEPALEPDPEPE